MESLKYFRQNKLKHIWCPGCGHGIVTGALTRAMDKLNIDKDKTVIVSGIGCSSRAPGYLDVDTLHTTHGRALAFATGIKTARPELNVIVMTGDGDCTAIGGNHFIHASRRNIDITTIVLNNSIYGMTSGQYSPMTPKGVAATTSPYGNIDRSFDICKLAQGAGATFVGRATAYHTQLLIDLIVKGIQNKGFSVIEAISQCPTYFGRRTKMGTPVDMMKWQKDNAVNVKAAEKLPKEKLEGKFLIGELHYSPEPEYTEEYKKLISQLQRRN